MTLRLARAGESGFGEPEVHHVVAPRDGEIARLDPQTLCERDVGVHWSIYDRADVEPTRLCDWCHRTARAFVERDDLPSDWRAELRIELEREDSRARERGAATDRGMQEWLD